MIYTQIRAFDAVAREGSFSRAAEVLGVTQPALTIQVKALEERYGVKLLLRQGRTVTLTELGARLFKMSRRLAGLEEQIRETLTASHELEQGQLRLAVDGPHIVMGIFARFIARHPNVGLSVALGNSRFVRQELLDRRADIAILPGVAGHPQIHAVPLWHHRGIVIVARDHPWAGRAAIDLSELDGQPMVGREEGSMTQRLVEEALAKAGAVPRTVLELGSREALCAAVAAGLGLGIVWELEASLTDRLAAIPIAGDVIGSTDYVACLKSEWMRKSIKAFFQVALALPGGRPDSALRAAP
ncbi:LysR family transcriptional regulator [Stella humosa]|uniref:LysR family transcriptional regulator n=1 Tax=Stella humosa TaxID=94 RepID=A0A3N1KM05_9PROT|nr:LysR substrate-binding domain-containing protein [Stella humosa]ROP81374.1 LysR family transcriptional regulator [Stella humosa]BBK32725.1 transcriptional regulator [Stella humosa]